jgi:hypothetical protein
MVFEHIAHLVYALSALVKYLSFFARFPDLFLSGAAASFAIYMPCKHSTMVDVI